MLRSGGRERKVSTLERGTTYQAEKDPREKPQSINNPTSVVLKVGSRDQQCPPQLEACQTCTSRV